MGDLLRHWAAIAVLTVLTALFAGCGVEYPAPVVVAVQPERGWNGSETFLAISGSNFYPQVWVEAGRSDQARVDDGYTAFLVSALGEEFKLSGSSVNGYDRMDAVVKPGLTPGLYDVVVESPTGARGELVEGFRVTDTIADRLVLDNFLPTGVAANAIAVDVYLADPEGEPVFEAGFGVDIWLEDGSGADVTDVVFLTQEVDISSGAAPGHLSGVLQDVVVTFNVRVDTPGLYTLHARPQREAGVSSDSVLLQWEEALVDSVQIRLPTAPFEATVGEPFDVELAWVDILGNPVNDYSDVVFLQSTCSGFVDAVDVLGSAVVSVTLQVPCDQDEIFSIRDSAARSGTFPVLAGPPDHIDVALPPVVAVAGVELDVQAVIHDALHNPVSLAGPVVLSASTGGLSGAVCVASPFNTGVFNCVATPTVAAASAVLTATGGGIQGDSAPFDVLANQGSIGSLDIEVTSQPVAGTPFGVAVQPYDSWNNSVSAAGFAAGDWQISDDLDEAVCAYVGVAVDGRAEFDCTLFTARAGVWIDATLLPQAAVGASPTFSVLNGVLDRVVVTLPGGNAVQAGTPFDVQLTGFDAWDNPAAILANAVVDLSADGGTISPVSTVLGAGGATQVQVTLTRAGNTVIRVAQGAEVGASPAITVSPGATSGLKVSVVDAPWAWVGTPTSIRVEAVDAWQNRTGWSGSVTLDSRMTATPVVLVAVTNGVGTVPFTWVGTALDEVLDATSASWVGESAALDVAADCGPTGPAAVIDFGGFPEALACVDPITGLGSVSASFGSTIPGLGALVRYDVAVHGIVVASSGVAGLVFDLPGNGIHEVRGLVMDDAGCGDEVYALGYAGPDDGEPVGPIALTPMVGSLTAGIGSTAIDLASITDCSRDPAQGGTVLLRTTLGDLLGVAPTGAGLSATAGALGTAQATLDAVNVDTGGAAEIIAWVPTGAAIGSQVVAINGDDQRPTVWFQTPAGEDLGLVDTIEVIFSEPLLAGTVVPSNFLVTGPAAVTVLTADLDPTGTIATLTLSPPADGALGAWTLSIRSQVRDDAGNRLSGTWSGLASDYTGTFGDVGSPVDSVTCGGTVPASGRFRPDGDDGPGDEADQLSVALSTASAPAWWVATVETEPAGELIRLDREVPSGAVDAWVWDGRDATGRIVDNGSYRVEIAPLDGLGNRGSPCSEIAIVDNALGVSP